MSIEIQIKQIQVEKGKITERILRSLPKWFGIEQAILDYIHDVEPMLFWVAEVNGAVIGFTAVKQHFEKSAEIYVMGIVPEYHRRGIGRLMINEIEKELRTKGNHYLQVKTLSPSRESAEYAMTRKFYLSMGFEPLEEFPTLWGEANPCLLLVKRV